MMLFPRIDGIHIRDDGPGCLRHSEDPTVELVWEIGLKHDRWLSRREDRTTQHRPLMILYRGLRVWRLVLTLAWDWDWG